MHPLEQGSDLDRTFALTDSADEYFDLTPLEDRAAALVEAAMKAGADGADAVVAASRSTGVEVRKGKVEEAEGAENNAFSLRVFVGDRAASISANLTSDPAALAERAVAMAAVATPSPHVKLAPKELLADTFADLDLFDPTQLTFDQMKELVLECEAAALDHPHVSNSSGASFGRGLGGTVLATSSGFCGSYRSSRFSLSLAVVAGEGDGMERDYDFDTAHHFAQLRDANEIGKHAAERAVARLNPRRVPSQTAGVIFEPRMARSLVGHIASALNGASVARKTSFLRDDMGKDVFSDQISLSDDPYIQRGASSRPFDAEGVAGPLLNLVEEGRIANWLLDTSAASELGLTSNGRAVRSGSSTSPSTSNLILKNGTRSVEDMMKEMGTGLFVTELIGQGVNMVTGDYSRGASGYWFENGEKAYPVSEITIADNLRNMFAKLEPADNLEMGFSVNTPSLAIRDMTIAGS